MKSRWKTKAPCGKEGAVCRRRRRTQWRPDEDVGTRNSRNNEPSERRRSKQSRGPKAVEAMPKTIERTLSGSETAPPFHRTRRISLNYCAAYFFWKDGVCVSLAYLFPGRLLRSLTGHCLASTRILYNKSKLTSKHSGSNFKFTLHLLYAL